MKVLVTGGGGFLGTAICRELRARGHAVCSVSRSRHVALDALGVEQRSADLADADATHAAFAGGFDAVIHNAAKAGAWGPRTDYFRANVLGTRQVLAACRAHGIGRLVYTSTPSVTHDAARPVAGGSADEVPYATHFTAPYPETKCIAEREVLAANSPALVTLALRPRLIWGPGDPHLLPRLATRARAGRLRLVGDGRNLVDTTYVDNAAAAHADALAALAPGAACAGRAYFISNGEPRSMRDTLNALLAAVGAPPVTRHVPYRLAWGIGAACDALWATHLLPGEPPLTRFLAEQLATTHWYSMTPATRDFGYRPRIGFEAGLARLRADAAG
jgi:nucleoside-diphosphate-sugar epimerase